MTKYYYAIPHKGEIGEYEVEGSLTDFPRGVLLAYGNCCLITGLKSEEEAKEAMIKYPCNKNHPQPTNPKEAGR